MAFARIGKIDLYFERVGRGQRLLFISGTGGDLRVRPNVLDGPLAEAFDLAAYDQRGLGRSAKPDVPYAMADYADDAAGLLDHLGWPTAKVMGVSFGGMVAQELALRHPQRVERLVLACTSPGGAGGASYPLHELDALDAESRARLLIPISDVRHDEAWAKANPEHFARLVAQAAQALYADEPGRAAGGRRQLEARARHDAWERLGEIRCPVMIAAGRYDGIARPESQHNLASRIPGSALRFFEGGHLFMIQDKAALPAMIAFLNA